MHVFHFRYSELHCLPVRRVDKHSKINKMTAASLAVIWGPCIFARLAHETDDMEQYNTLLQLLINEYSVLFK